MYSLHRLATGRQRSGYDDTLVAVYGWDPDVLQRISTRRAVTPMRRWIDSVAMTAQLAAIDALIPAE
jgi:hypothetical protein